MELMREEKSSAQYALHRVVWVVRTFLLGFWKIKVYVALFPFQRWWMILHFGFSFAIHCNTRSVVKKISTYVVMNIDQR